MGGDGTLWCATAMGAVTAALRGADCFLTGFPGRRCACPGLPSLPPCGRGRFGQWRGGSIFFGNDSWKGKNNGKGKGKNNRGSFSYHPQAEESAWGPVHSG